MHPFVVAAAALLIGVTAFGARLIVQRRARRHAPTHLLQPEDEPAAPAPRRAELRPRPAWRAPEPVIAPAPPGTLRIRVTGPHGVVIRGAIVSALPHGAPEDGDATPLDENENEDGGFSATELAPGRYDLLVSAPGMRLARVEDVPTGEEVVEVSLARGAVLLGAVGDAVGEGCPDVTITGTGPDVPEDQPSQLTSVDADSCLFELDELPAVGPLTLVAHGRGWTERVLVTLPVAGDPAPVCFRPPCAAAPASLAIFVVDGAGRLVPGVALDWSRETETEGELGSTTVDGFALLHGRRAGQPLHLHASAGDRAVETTVLVGAGVADVVLTLPLEVGSVKPDDDQGGGGEDLVVGALIRERHAHRPHQEADLPALGD